MMNPHKEKILRIFQSSADGKSWEPLSDHSNEQSALDERDRLAIEHPGKVFIVIRGPKTDGSRC